MKIIKTLLLIAMSVIVMVSVVSCDNDDPELSSDKTVTSFTFRAIDNPGLSTDIPGSFEDDAIQFDFPPGVSVTSLTPTIVLPAGVSISPASGIPTDFSNPVTYTVTAKDGTTKAYAVTVVVQGGNLSTEKVITSFKFTKADNPSLQDDIQATINELQIVCTLPASVSLIALKPVIEFNGQSVLPNSGVATNFTSPVTYTVTAEDGTTENYVVNVSSSSGPSVYVAGAITKFGTLYAAVWKDGTATTITNGTYNSHITSLFISGNVLHAAGNITIGNSRASSWKIENEVQLPTPKLNETNNDGYANSIFVSAENDIYIAGHEYKNAVGFVAKVWKNGVVTPLSTGFGVATAVSVSGSDVYVSGYEAVGPSIYAKLWKNGTATILSPDDERAHGKGVFVSGGDVYVPVQYFNGAEAKLKVWKNGSTLDVTTNGYADVHSIFVSGNDVYLAGYSLDVDMYRATLWINGVPTFLSSKRSSEARSVYVHNGDVYVAGFEPVDGNTNNAVLWKNGVPTVLSTNAFASSVVVK